MGLDCEILFSESALEQNIELLSFYADVLIFYYRKYLQNNVEISIRLKHCVLNFFFLSYAIRLGTSQRRRHGILHCPDCVENSFD